MIRYGDFGNFDYYITLCTGSSILALNGLEIRAIQSPECIV
jgi:hypothetical protein